MTAIDTAMVLAAGFGTRMGALTRDRPKPLLRVAGRSLIDRTLDTVEQAGLSRAVVNLHYLGEQIRAHLAPRQTPELGFSDEQPQILETGGGIVQALPSLGPRPFAVLNSDAVFAGSNPLQPLLNAWAPHDMDALMLLVPTMQARAYTRAGDFFLDRPGTAPVRRGEASSAPLVYTGAQIITPDAFRDAPEGPFSTNIIWDRLLARNRLAAVVYDGLWVDVGTAEGLETAASALEGVD